MKADTRVQFCFFHFTVGEDAKSSADFYGVEKVVYTKASYNALSFGITKDLVIANIDGSSKDTVLQDIPDTSSGASRFILLPESNEVLLAVPGVVTYQKIDFEKINLETRERIKFGTYEQKWGVELQGAIVSPDQKNLLFTTSGMKVFLTNLEEPYSVPTEPIYTAESGMLIPEVWDERGNVYLSNFPCFPCFPREPEKNTDDKPLPVLQMNLPKKRLSFFKNIESYGFSADKNYLAWTEQQENNDNVKVKVYSAKDDAIWVVDSCKVMPKTLIWRNSTHIQYKVADEYSEYANIVYDVESHTKDMNPIPPSYKVEGRITHDIKIEEGKERGSVEGAKLYINDVLIDSIEGLDVPYGHSFAFEVLGFIHGKPVAPRDLELLYPSYLPEGIKLTELDKTKYNDCYGVICEMDIVGNFGVLKIRQFAGLESLYFASALIDDTATFRHLLRGKEDVTFDGGKGTYYDLETLPGERRLYFTKGDSKIQFFCYGGCTLSKEELVKIAQSMNIKENNMIMGTLDWKIYRSNKHGFEFKYPEEVFTLVPVETSVFPDFDMPYEGEKLIGAGAAKRLGEKECWYGEAGFAMICNAASEDGISFMVINESLDYFKRFGDAGEGEKEVMIAGKTGILYGYGAEGYNFEHYYVPMEEKQTLVITIKSALNWDSLIRYPSKELVDQILSTFRFVE